MRESYLSIDRRVLGIFRILLGAVLLYDLLRRAPYISLLYSNDGVLTNHYALYAIEWTPQLSLLFPFSTPAEVRIGFAMFAIALVMFLVGYRTKLAQILALVVIASVNMRNLFLDNGGVAVMLVLLAMTSFLPLGSRYSVDSLVERFKRCADPAEDAVKVGAERTAATSFRSLMVAGLLAELAAIYWLNATQKTGPSWRDGSAVHFILWQNRYATPLAAWLRLHEPSWLSPFATWGTLITEHTLPFLLLSPVFVAELRAIALVWVCLFHLSIASMMNLGPFSFAMICFSVIVLPGAWIDRAETRLRERLPRTTVTYDPERAGEVLLARILATLDGLGVLLFRRGGQLAASRGDETATGASAFSFALDSVPCGRLLASFARSASGLALIQRTLDRTRGGRGRPIFLRRPIRSIALAREAAAAVLIVTLAIQATNANLALEHVRIPMPDLLAPLVAYPRIIQGWNMFTPDIPRDDGMMVVDAVLADGRHIDPFTGRAPDDDLPRRGPVPHPGPMLDYLVAMHRPANERWLRGLSGYLARRHTIEHLPSSERIVSFDAWWVSHDCPPRGSTTLGAATKSLVVSGP